MPEILLEFRSYTGKCTGSQQNQNFQAWVRERPSNDEDRRLKGQRLFDGPDHDKDRKIRKMERNTRRLKKCLGKQTRVESSSSKEADFTGPRVQRVRRHRASPPREDRCHSPRRDIRITQGVPEQGPTSQHGIIGLLQVAIVWSSATPEVVSLCLITGLLEGDFRRHLTSKDITSMEEIHRIAHEYMRDEDVSKVVSGNKKNPTSQPNKGGSQGLSTLPIRPPIPRVGKFNTYTPLNASLTEDALEQAIREGKFPEFVQHVRPAKRQGNEDEREAQNPRSQRQTELASDTAQVMINVVVGTTQLKKSMSAVHKNTGGDYNLLFCKAFEVLTLRDHHLKPHLPGVVGIGDHIIKPDCAVDLLMTFREDDGRIATLRGDRVATITCNNTSLSLRKKAEDCTRVFTVDLDACLEENPRPEPDGNLEKFQLGETVDKYTMINRDLPFPLNRSF
ncbi:hypothetical protein PIB30_055675 [Stylosanthes scabra]|uniref:Uncharacterized protein n=1 Tax=Stylosanthes scabra TaxID=79078 RepID=A0ABU6ZHW2_9FABA|nr:hypothetical protein [Stylosanthes scabra]